MAYVFPTQKLASPKTNKTPLVLVACGSFSPITYLHLRMFEMALDWANFENFELIGGYFSPVSDEYKKTGLVAATHRVKMCDLAVSKSTWLMVDHWEATQPTFSRTVTVLDHFDECLNIQDGVLVEGIRKRIKIMLLAGGDLIQSFAVPKLWAKIDVFLF